MTDYGKLVLKLLLKKGMTSADLADEVGVSKSEISYIINGKRNSKDIEQKINACIASHPDDVKVDDFELAVRFELIDRDLKVAELAKILDVSRAAAYYAISGKRQGFERLRARISEYLNI